METQSIAAAEPAPFIGNRKLHWSAPIDRELTRAYQLIAQGRAVDRALEVGQCGVDSAGENGLPKLALCRADAMVLLRHRSRRLGHDDRRRQPRPHLMGPGPPPSGTILNSRSILAWPARSFPYNESARTWRRQSLVPPCPHLRPKRGLQNYHVLWGGGVGQGPAHIHAFGAASARATCGWSSPRGT